MTDVFPTACRQFLRKHGFASLSDKSGVVEFVAALAQVLIAENDNEQVVEEAARWLALIGAPAEAAIPGLVAIIAKNPFTPTLDEIELRLNRNTPWACSNATRAAMDALQQISPTKAVQAVASLCKGTDPQVRFRGLLALQAIGEPSDEIIPHVLDLLQDKETRIRRAAVLALWPYSNLAKPVIGALTSQGVEDPDWLVRLRIDYLLARNVAEYERRYRDGIMDILDALLRSAEGDMPVDAIQTVTMLGADEASRFLKRIIELLQSEAAVTMPAAAAVTIALAELARHYPLLVGEIESSLDGTAAQGKPTACLVRDGYSVEMRMGT